MEIIKKNEEKILHYCTGIAALMPVNIDQFIRLYPLFVVTRVKKMAAGL
ncbi:hypothetical protein [Lacrimispora sp.]